MFFIRKAGITFKSRGDIASGDWAIGDLTRDGAWHDLDCSAKIRAGAKLVRLRISIVHDSAGAVASFRKKGYTNNINIVEVATGEAGITCRCVRDIEVDSDGVAQYKFTANNWSSIALTILGDFK